MFSQRKTEGYPTVKPSHGIFAYDLVYAEEKLLNLLDCFAAPVWRFLWAKQFENVQVLVAKKRGTTEMNGLNFHDWSEFSIGTNFERLVRIPNDWFEF
jgi:hypothetical protein